MSRTILPALQGHQHYLGPDGFPLCGCGLWDEDRKGDEKMSDKTLTVTSDKVLEAAKQCPDAKRVLTTLFPEAFAEDTGPGSVVLPKDTEFLYLSLSTGPQLMDKTKKSHTTIMEPRNSTQNKPYDGKAFWLNTSLYDFSVKEESPGIDILVIRRKG